MYIEFLQKMLKKNYIKSFFLEYVNFLGAGMLG